MADITGTGVSQEDLVTFMENVVAAVNELKADVNATLVKMDADFADVANASVDYAASNPVEFEDLTLTGL